MATFSSNLGMFFVPGMFTYRGTRVPAYEPLPREKLEKLQGCCTQQTMNMSWTKEQQFVLMGKEVRGKCWNLYSYSKLGKQVKRQDCTKQFATMFKMCSSRSPPSNMSAELCRGPIWVLRRLLEPNWMLRSHNQRQQGTPTVSATLSFPKPWIKSSIFNLQWRYDFKNPWFQSSLYILMNVMAFFPASMAPVMKLGGLVGAQSHPASVNYSWWSICSKVPDPLLQHPQPKKKLRYSIPPRLTWTAFVPTYPGNSEKDKVLPHWVTLGTFTFVSAPLLKPITLNSWFPWLTPPEHPTGVAHVVGSAWGFGSAGAALGAFQEVPTKMTSWYLSTRNPGHE